MSRALTRGVPHWAPIIVIALSLLVLYLLWDILIIFLIAAFLAFVLHPVVELLDRRLPRVVSILTVFLFFAAILVLAGILLVPVAVAQFEAFFSSVPAYIEQGRDLLNGLQSRYFALPSGTQGIVDSALEQLQSLAGTIAQMAIPALISLVASLITLVIVPVLTFFMLLDHKGYARMILALVPRHARPSVADLMRQLDQAMWAFIRGQSLLMLSVGLATGIGLYLVGMPYPVVFGIIAGLLEVIPNFGPTITFIIVTLVALVISPFLALKAGAVAIGVQLLENSLLSPVVLATAVDLDPVTVALAVFVGGAVAGPLGVLVSIPLAVMIKIVLLYYYAQDSEVVSERKRCKSRTCE